MKVFLNDNEVVLDGKTSLQSLLQNNQITELNGIAVALNETVVSKSEWESLLLNENDRIMVITATAGG